MESFVVNFVKKNLFPGFSYEFWKDFSEQILCGTHVKGYLCTFYCIVAESVYKMSGSIVTKFLMILTTFYNNFHWRKAAGYKFYRKAILKSFTKANVPGALLSLWSWILYSYHVSIISDRFLEHFIMIYRKLELNENRFAIRLIQNFFCFHQHELYINIKFKFSNNWGRTLPQET